jgi:integrase
MARKKRASGEGTIRKRPNGLWEARLSISGQYRTKSFYGKTQAEAHRKREEARKALEAGHSLDSQRQTVGEYLEGWIEGPLNGSVAPKTYADYAWICRKHLIPEIGRIRLSKLTAEDLDQLYARKTAAGLGPRTVGYIHSTVRVALQRAVKKRLILYNVARDAEPPPREPKKERTTLSLEQVANFFKAAAEAESRFEALFIVAVLAGPRPGELLGLKWPDLVLPDKPDTPGEARIRRAVSLVRGKPHLRDTTKTGKGRPVHLLPEAVAALKAHRLRYLEERLRYAEVWNAAWRAEPRHEDLVFPSLNGGPMDRDNLAARHFKPLLKRAELPDIRLYDLRHTFATLWLESGEHPKILQEILGHSRISITLDTYSHVIPHMQREAMGRFGRMFSKSS